MISEHYDRIEFKCNCGKCSCDTVDYELLQVLEDVREFFNSPVTVNSGHRCEKYNEAVGGKENSKHLLGQAADIVVRGVHPHTVYNFLDRTYHSKYGLGRYDTFTHIDVRSQKARW